MCIIKEFSLYFSWIWSKFSLVKGEDLTCFLRYRYDRYNTYIDMGMIWMWIQTWMQVKILAYTPQSGWLWDLNQEPSFLWPSFNLINGPDNSGREWPDPSTGSLGGGWSLVVVLTVTHVFHTDWEKAWQNNHIWASTGMPRVPELSKPSSAESPWIEWWCLQVTQPHPLVLKIGSNALIQSLICESKCWRSSSPVGFW